MVCEKNWPSGQNKNYKFYTKLKITNLWNNCSKKKKQFMYKFDKIDCVYVSNNFLFFEFNTGLIRFGWIHISKYNNNIVFSKY